jgi:hypothetical protein
MSSLLVIISVGTLILIDFSCSKPGIESLPEVEFESSRSFSQVSESSSRMVWLKSDEVITSSAYRNTATAPTGESDLGVFSNIELYV